MGRILVVTSGKGGAGKSTVTAGIGCALAREGHKVLLIDGDAGLRSLDLMLGISSTMVYDMADVFAGRCSPAHAVYPSPIYPNVFVLPAPARLDQLCSPDELRRLCRGLSRFYDEVIVDCPAGVGKGFETAVCGAQQALVVTTPDLVCARDAQIVSRLLDEKRIPSRLIINRLRVRPVLKGAMPDLDEIIDTAGIRLIGVIPEDERVAVANAYGQPLPTDATASVCFRNIAGRLLGRSVPLMELASLKQKS